MVNTDFFQKFEVLLINKFHQKAVKEHCAALFAVYFIECLFDHRIRTGQSDHKMLQIHP
ncbi:hypothetical protein D3C73_1328680 [compost metagenome]